LNSDAILEIRRPGKSIWTRKQCNESLVKKPEIPLASGSTHVFKLAGRAAVDCVGFLIQRCERMLSALNQSFA
jgi:hypothetical protein